MARPKKVQVDTNTLTDDVKSSTDFVITRVYDPSGFPEKRELDAYTREELDKYLRSGWLILEGNDHG